MDVEGRRRGMVRFVAYSCVAFSLYNYRWFVSQVLVFGTFAVCAAVCVVERARLRRALRPLRNGWPLKNFLAMACLDALSSVSVMLAVGVLNGPVGVVIPQVSRRCSPPPPLCCTLSPQHVACAAGCCITFSLGSVECAALRRWFRWGCCSVR
jgi:hypothetical protein